MAPTSLTEGSPEALPSHLQSSQPVSTSQGRHPLRREGAVIFLSPSEQALQDAMLRSSPPPEPLLGKRAHEQEDVDTEPEEEGTSATGLAPPPAPSFSNVSVAASRYATHKKLRAEQRDELEAFLQVRTSPMYFSSSILNIGQDTTLGRQAKLFVSLLSVENKIDVFRSAAPPYQVTDELKACIST